MRLATILTDDGPRGAVVRDDGIVELGGYADVGAILRDGARGDDAARSADRDGSARPFAEDRLLRPVLVPGAIVCVGLNYRAHILEMGRELPSSPTLFSKLARALTDPYADVELPVASRKMDYEGELAVVIGSGGRHIAAEDAWGRVAGLTVLNDVSARDLQNRSVQWFAGKTLQRSTPMGPWLVTTDECPDLSSAELTVSVNGELRQQASLGDLVFDVPALVADLSRIVELEPGDVIATGTPGGVGAASDEFLQPGDTVEVSIEGIGTIRNTFRGPR